ncbi:hypothetical protein GLOTRDRAFT_48330 [Gloeophyllum trabeum ATCC 11539]|uniref:Hydrophobin n=1 Tax=Gloeophyllum trabeum (strain ATCC 11539 / FP-39264 / Madison 617) TaxID=670483 RepID=S7RCB5_GLOTA|nr:uncharacterized protein GLOTRDRAFT_48330 [Gloeophyllum trabeum ATCC 11539]EPQ51865.1 hypothetical protein GLOTRDRAFT_48330 [Gloeophyllum trabeum ATCC 11539]
MRSTLLFTILAVALPSILSVSALPPNAERLRRGLTPLKPKKRFSPTAGAKRSAASSTPTTCANVCCQTLSTAASSSSSLLLSLLGIVVHDLSTPVGLTCQSMQAGASCAHVSLCCQDNTYGGIIAIGCTAV